MKDFGMNALDVELGEAMADLVSAEDFLDFFGIVGDPTVVQVNRLHILQRFHNYLRALPGPVGRDACRACLQRAYDDFVRSDAQTEKVFRVFRKAAGIATVPLDAIGRTRPS